MNIYQLKIQRQKYIRKWSILIHIISIKVLIGKNRIFKIHSLAP